MTMTAHNFLTLRQANADRNIIWTDGRPFTAVWRGCELAGEVGEYYAALQADEEGQGNITDAADKIAEELADIIICADLTAMDFDYSLFEAMNVEHEVPKLRYSYDLARDVGLLCNVLKKLERERLDLKGSRASRSEVGLALYPLIINTMLAASDYGIELWPAVVDKFNATSDKVGIKTKLAV